MNSVNTAAAYLKENVQFQFCKGCGHHHYVHRLNDALEQLNIDPQHVCIVSDIGCIGILDSLFTSPHTFHTTHGRSTAFATGIELADGILHDSKLKSIVVIGDGGATIGLLHIVNAALMNVDVTVLVANNMLYGMTGGQNSGFSPVDFITATTPNGNIVPPLNICAMVKSCGAEYVSRISATDSNLTTVIAEAVKHPGFALVEIVELCTEYAVGKNKIDGKSLRETIEKDNNRVDVLNDKFVRKEFVELYKTNILSRQKKSNEDSIAQKFSVPDSVDQRWVIAGTAGEKVQLASYLTMRAAIMCGLHATQKNDNPVTQGSGFSLSELCISSTPIHYTGIDVPDAVVISSTDGFKEVQANGTLSRCVSKTFILVDESVPAFSAEGVIRRMPLRSLCTPQRATLSAVAALLSAHRLLPPEAMAECLRERFGEKASQYQYDIEKILPYVLPLQEDVR